MKEYIEIELNALRAGVVAMRDGARRDAKMSVTDGRSYALHLGMVQAFDLALDSIESSRVDILRWVKEIR